MPVHPISFTIPPNKVVDRIPTKTRITAAIVPGDTSTYIYKTEADYYKGYQDSYFGITMKKSGWDCMRHYEIMANGCIPYFEGGVDAIPKNTMTLFPKDIIVKTNDLYERVWQKQAHALDEAEERALRSHIEDLLAHTRLHLTTTSIVDYILSASGFDPRAVGRVLFLSGSTDPDYLRCVTLIGFKAVFGSRCHDYPKVAHIYQDYGGDVSRLYGRGMTYSKTVPPSHESREDAYDATVVHDIVNRAYDVIIYGSYHRGTPLLDTVSKVYKPEELIFLCGEDCDWFSNCETHDCALKRDAFSKCNVFIRELA
jgi:hypothetical protein